MGGITERQTNKTIKEIEDFLHQRRSERKFWRKFKKSIDFSNALRYIKNITKKKQKKEIKVMSEPTTTAPVKSVKKVNKNKTSGNNIAASIIGAPFIIAGVASLVQSNIPYFEYVIGTLIAGFVVYLLTK